jgi:predicted Fe-S protein YdhL (DUF1289 family)
MTPESKTTDTTPLNQVDHVRKITPCGGCGATSDRQRCLGCFHDFGDEASEWVQGYASTPIAVAASALTPSAAVAPAGEVETVAEAINKARYLDDDGIARGLPYRPLAESSPTDRAYCTKLARAALSAAPTPTEAPRSETARPVGEEMGWRPIDTVPKSRKPVDLWLRSYIDLADGGRQLAVEFRIPGAVWFDNQWTDEEGRTHPHLEGFSADQITHWSWPLPPPDVPAARPVGEDALREALARADKLLQEGIEWRDMYRRAADERDALLEKLATPTQPAAGQGAGDDLDARM